ncbi:MAG TPA: YMGG-like glycine zipper-containing protein [Pyrinomonadaceae bacterium]|nr:YMGG-like glycine zipper-containing protein [Pyrinomonadaceae bacterium]
MRTANKILSLAVALALTTMGLVTAAQGQRQYRMTDNQMRQLLQRIENRTNTFSRNLDNTLRRSGLRNTAQENEINRYVADFESSLDQLRTRFNNRQSTATEVRVALERAALINNFILTHRLGAPVNQNWRMLQSDLNQLARSHNINWQWNTVPTTVGHRLSDTEMRQLVRRIENRSDRFRDSLDRALNRSNLAGTTQDEIKGRVSDFENATNQLRDSINNRQSTSALAQDVLQRAVYVNTFMQNHRLDARAESDWNLLRNDLNQLAGAYDIAWNWTTSPLPTGPGYGIDGRLTGTYRLNPAQSTNVQVAVQNATRNLPAARRQRAHDALISRLDPPNIIAIEQRGNSVAIASTRAPQVNFIADGREHLETTPTGRTVRVRTTLQGDQLTVASTGDRATDFTVTFDPIDNGRRLLVTRRIYSERLTQPVTVQTYYDRTSDVAQLNIHSTTPDYGNVGTVTGDFVVPDGTQLMATLNTSLSTKTTRENDPFTMTVRSPAQYSGAVIEGYVTNVNRGGRITGRSEMLFNFDRIRLRDGRTYRFAGLVENVQAPGQDDVRVDNEGAVQESDSQTERTVTRTAIGTAVGAIIGAIAGGGKGAAIGAAIGAGAGAGSVYVQGRDDLELDAGTEVTVRAAGPR